MDFEIKKDDINENSAEKQKITRRHPTASGAVKKKSSGTLSGQAKQAMAARARMILGGQGLSEIADSLAGNNLQAPVLKQQADPIFSSFDDDEIIYSANEKVEEVEPTPYSPQAGYAEYNTSDVNENVDDVSEYADTEEYSNADDEELSLTEESAEEVFEEAFEDVTENVTEEVVSESSTDDRSYASGSFYDIFGINNEYLQNADNSDLADKDDLIEISEGVFEPRFKHFCRKNTVVDGVLKKDRSEEYDVDIPKGITIIGMRAFNSGKRLNKVVMANSITKIEKEAFWNCQYLKHVHFSRSLVSIGEAAFWGCYAIEELELPSSLERIGKQAFKYCENLKTIKISDKVKKISEGAFHGCYGMNTVKLPSTLESIECYAFCECKNLSEISIPRSVTKIGDFAFMGCALLQEVYIPENVRYIGKGVFDGCANLKKVTLHKGVAIPEGFVEKGVAVEYL